MVVSDAKRISETHVPWLALSAHCFSMLSVFVVRATFLMQIESYTFLQTAPVNSYLRRMIKLWIVVCWLLNVPATCECISGTDLFNFTCCHTEVEVADFYLTLSQYTCTGPTSPSTDPITPGTEQGSHWSANF